MKKVCSRCKKLLDSSEFYSFPRNKDGLSSYCKSCLKEKAKIYNNSKGKEKSLIISRRQRDKGYFRFGKGAFLNMKKSAEKRGIQFELTEEDLKIWWLSSPDYCAYCGCSVDEYIRMRDFLVNYEGDNEEILRIRESVFNKDIYKKLKTMTIDRVDSLGPYAKDNIVKACWICNSLKSNSVTFEEMIKRAKDIRKMIEMEMEK